MNEPSDARFKLEVAEGKGKSGYFQNRNCYSSPKEKILLAASVEVIRTLPFSTSNYHVSQGTEHPSDDGSSIMSCRKPTATDQVLDGSSVRQMRMQGLHAKLTSGRAHERTKLSINWLTNCAIIAYALLTFHFGNSNFGTNSASKPVDPHAFSVTVALWPPWEIY